MLFKKLNLISNSSPGYDNYLIEEFIKKLSEKDLKVCFIHTNPYDQFYTKFKFDLRISLFSQNDKNINEILSSLIERFNNNEFDILIFNGFHKNLINESILQEFINSDIMKAIIIMSYEYDNIFKDFEQYDKDCYKLLNNNLINFKHNNYSLEDLFKILDRNLKLKKLTKNKYGK